MIQGMCFVMGVAHISVPISLFCYSPEEQFTIIYDNGIWLRNEEGLGSSGIGSQMSTTEGYRNFIAEFLSSMKIESVVDAGCGDWGFSHAIDWSGIDYKGFDIVKSVIDRNEKRFTKPNVHFFHTNFIQEELPPADLLICKDVLQHLPIEDVSTFIKQFSKYKYCLITNDVDRGTGTCVNKDVDRSLGAYRFLDLTQPPYNVSAERVFMYDKGDSMKLVLLIKNDRS